MSPRNFYDKTGSCFVDGMRAEDLFRINAEGRGFIHRPVSPHVNKYDHIDCELRVIKDGEIKHAYVDVKSMKAINRGDDAQDDMTLIEFQSVGGYPGWLYGKATHIAFKFSEGFAIVKRRPLVDLCESLVDINSEPLKSTRDKRPYVLYQRWVTNENGEHVSRNDKFAFIPSKDIFNKIRPTVWKFIDEQKSNNNLP